MKYLMINGSPHEGNSWAAANFFKSKLMLSDTEAVFEQIHLASCDIPFCVSCYNCFIKGEQFCPHKNVEVIAQKISECDFLIVTSPTYSLGVCALLKNFIDHMSYNYHRPRFFTKKALVISSTAGAGATGVTKYVRDVLKFWGFNRVHKFAFRSVNLRVISLSSKVQTKIEKLSINISKDLLSGKLQKPSIKRVFFFNAWRAISGADEYEKSADNRYWTDNDMKNDLFDKRIKIGVGKKLIGKIAYSVFNRFI